MVVLNSGQCMFECNVLYIGSAPPIDTLSGTDALQEPLRQRYPGNLEDVQGIDTVLRVRPECLEMQQSGSNSLIQFPLDRLKICAAVRFVRTHDVSTGEETRQFVPLNTLRPDTSQPAIFAAIIRRSQGREIAECHAFVCSSPREALHLVNTTAAANLNLKAMRGQRMSESVKYQNGVPVIHDVREGYGTINGEDVRYVGGGGGDLEGAGNEQYQSDNDTIYIKSSIIRENVQQEVTPEPVRHYVENNFKYQQNTPEPVQTEKPKTIYITFDKSNLIPMGDNSMQMPAGTSIQYTAPRTRPMTMQGPPRIIRAQAPPPPVVYRRPISPGPMYVRGPAPPPQVFVGPPPRPPPQPVLIGPPPPPTVLAPAPTRMYTKRVMSPPPRLVAPPPPVYYRTRARSSSPEMARSEMMMRIPQPSRYQPKWRSHSSDIVEYRQSRRDVPARAGPPPPPPEMFMNERAFSRRINADHRFTRYAVPGYNYPTAYDFHDVMMYDRPVSKSNPRYSSSSSGDGDDDLRFRRKN